MRRAPWNAEAPDSGARVNSASTNAAEGHSRPPEFARSSPLLAVLWGRNGLRAGWRLVFFMLTAATLSEIGRLVLGVLDRHHAPENRLTAQGLGWWLTHTKALVFIFVLLASWIMAKIEHRQIADYGLPWRRAFRGRFWFGAAIGFAALTGLLGAMHLVGVFSMGRLGRQDAHILWRYAVSSALVFLIGALFEEWFFRGYFQFALTSGIGFWPAAVVTSTVFGCLHYGNPGETGVGILSAGAVGFLFCLLLRRTGDLWMPIGFHAAWNWGETYFYGVPNSGGPALRRLFPGSFSGPPWLTGGSAGPEGSWLCLALIATLYLVLAIWLKEAKYPRSSTVDAAGSHLTPLKA
jgi:membrane protease YdiL (CAAX protease family)